MPGWRGRGSAGAGEHFEKGDRHYCGQGIFASESLAIGLKVGDNLRVEVSALGQTMIGTFDKIVPYSEPGARTLLVKIRLPSDPRMFAGIFARVAVHPRPPNFMRFPRRNTLNSRHSVSDPVPYQRAASSRGNLLFGVAKGSQKAVRHLAIDRQVVVPLKISDRARNVDFHRIIHSSVVSKFD